MTVSQKMPKSSARKRNSKVPLPARTRHEPAEASLEAIVAKLADRGTLRQAARRAIRKQVEHGFASVYRRGNFIVRQRADGKIETIRAIRKLPARAGIVRRVPTKSGV